MFAEYIPWISVEVLLTVVKSIFMSILAPGITLSFSFFTVPFTKPLHSGSAQSVNPSQSLSMPSMHDVSVAGHTVEVDVPVDVVEVVKEVVLVVNEVVEVVKEVVEVVNEVVEVVKEVVDVGGTVVVVSGTVSVSVEPSLQTPVSIHPVGPQVLVL